MAEELKVIDWEEAMEQVGGDEEFFSQWSQQFPERQYLVCLNNEPQLLRLRCFQQFV